MLFSHAPTQICILARCLQKFFEGSSSVAISRHGLEVKMEDRLLWKGKFKMEDILPTDGTITHSRGALDLKGNRGKGKHTIDV